MKIKSFTGKWALSFICCFALATLSYFSIQGNTELRPVLSWMLWPGVWLYGLLNGSLFFGGGFGDLGNFLVVGIGSALVWSLLVACCFSLIGKRVQRGPD